MRILYALSALFLLLPLHAQEPGRYQVFAATIDNGQGQKESVLIKFDSSTGETWRYDQAKFTTEKGHGVLVSGWSVIGDYQDCYNSTAKDWPALQQQLDSPGPTVTNSNGLIPIAATTTNQTTPARSILLPEPKQAANVPVTTPPPPSETPVAAPAVPAAPSGTSPAVPR